MESKSILNLLKRSLYSPCKLNRVGYDEVYLEKSKFHMDYISGDNFHFASLFCGIGMTQTQILTFFWRNFLFSFFYHRNRKKWRNLCYL